MNSKNKSAQSNTSADNESRPKAAGTDRDQKMPASQRASEAARRGEPLEAENRKDRSPKQENL